MAGKEGRRTWGSIRPSRGQDGWQASYIHLERRWFAPEIFASKGDADLWLSSVRVAISKGAWVRPDFVADEAITLRAFATGWLATKNIAVRTREHYQYLLDRHILPELGDRAIGSIKASEIRAWHSREAKPTAKAHSYVLLSQIMIDAVNEDMITASPCRVRGASTAPTVKQVEYATQAEVAALAEAVPERYRMLILIGAYCSLRFGELAGLRVEDVDLINGSVRIRQTVVRTRAGLLTKAPKTEAGKRKVPVPAKLLAELETHIKEYSREGWVFPARYTGPLAWSSAHKVIVKAAKDIGRPDITLHILRHSGQTWAAEAGASLPVLMARAGQVSQAAALRYLHEAEGSQRRIADSL